MTQGEVSVKIEEGGEGEAVSNGDDSSPTEETNAYDKWPQAGIKEPTNNDVLYGRGGGTNHHQGNKRYRLLVEEKKVEKPEGVAASPAQLLKRARDLASKQEKENDVGGHEKRSMLNLMSQMKSSRGDPLYALVVSRRICTTALPSRRA